nr:S-layer homology domain-containing protein [Sedimentibacter sp.]
MKNFSKKIITIGICINIVLNLNFIAYADVLDTITDTSNNETYIPDVGIEDDTYIEPNSDINTQTNMSTKTNEPTFSDIAGHWAESRIKEASKIGFVTGYQDGSFKPDKTVTRAEFATLLNNAMKNNDTIDINLKDVKNSDWYYNQIEKAVAVGYFSGYEDNTFRPNNPITRQEVAKVISNAITTGDIDGDGATLLADYSSIQDWAKNSVNIAYNKSYIMGYPNKVYMPSKALTRAEAVKIIYEILDNENIELGFNITNYNESYYGAVVVGDLNIFDSVGSGNVYINNVTVLGDINILAKNVDSVILTDVKVRNIVVDDPNNSVKITCNDNIYINNVKLSADATILKLGNNVQIKNTIVQ